MKKIRKSGCSDFGYEFSGDMGSILSDALVSSGTLSRLVQYGTPTTQITTPPEYVYKIQPYNPPTDGLNNFLTNNILREMPSSTSTIKTSAPVEALQIAEAPKSSKTLPIIAGLGILAYLGFKDS